MYGSDDADTACFEGMKFYVVTFYFLNFCKMTILIHVRFSVWYIYFF